MALTKRIEVYFTDEEYEAILEYEKTDAFKKKGIKSKNQLLRCLINKNGFLDSLVEVYRKMKSSDG
jgi:hypothetical protein